MASRRRTARLVGYGLASGLLVAAVRQAMAGLVGGDRWNWAEFAVLVATWALLTSVFVWWPRWLAEREFFAHHPAQRKRRWREDNVTPVVRSGVLPDGIDAAMWRRPMRDELQELQGAFGVWLGLNAVAAGLTVATAVVANDNAWTVWLVAVVVAAQGVLGARLMWPRLRTARRLLAELDDRRVGS